jgi:hypothetical protein
MELFIAIIIAGVLVYEFYTGAIVVQNGARSRAVSRSDRPGHFWFWITLQVVFLVVLVLSWLGIINFSL